MRRFYEMKLLRSRTPIFALTFQVMHPIDEDSPLFGMTAADLAAEEAEFVVLVTGIDATVSQTIHARFSYSHEDLLWDHRFADIFGYTEQGEAALDFRKFHDSVPLSAAPSPGEPRQAADRAAAIGAGTD